MDFSLTIDPCELEDSGDYKCQGIGEPTENETSPIIFEESIKVSVIGKIFSHEDPRALTQHEKGFTIFNNFSCVYSRCSE